MKKEIIEIIERLEYNQSLIKKVNDLSFKDTVSKNPYLDLEALKNASESKRFTLSLYALVSACKDYKKMEIPFLIFKESMQDFNLRATKFYNENDFWGIRDVDLKWLNLLFKLQIFKLHTLRFQMFPMDYQEMEREGHDLLVLSPKIKEQFPEGLPLINTHIETDTNLHHQAVGKSLILAKSFFNEFFPNFQAKGFITRTWFLHPSLKQLLDESSNIIKFANRFKIIGLSNNYNQALNRIYGTRDIKEIQEMKKNSSLEKEAYKIYQDLGVGIGYLKMEEIE